LLELKIDGDFKKLIPPLTEEEYKQLEENLKKDGCRDSLVIWNGTIIDGHNRYEICTKYNIEFNTTEIKFNAKDDVVEWIIRNQFGRRNISDYVKAELALRLENVIKARAKENQINSGKDYGIGKKVNLNSEKPIRHINTHEELAKIAGVSKDTIWKTKVIKNEGSEELQAQARKGEISINKAFNLTRKPEIVKANEEIEMRVCSVCGKEKPISEYYNNFKECKTCNKERKTNKISVKKARELNKNCPREMIEAIYEDMKNPTPKAVEVGNEKHISNPIITEYEELLNDFIRNIRKFTYMPQVKESETLKILTDETIEILKKIMN